MTDLSRRTLLAGAPLLDLPPSGATNLPIQPSMVASHITFGPGIVIDGATGNVTVPKDLSLTDASIAFWEMINAVFPDFLKQCRQK